MRFEVPQYIEIESKIVGPLTLRQFLFLAGAGLIIFLTHFIFSGTFWFVLSLVAGSIALLFAFWKPEGQRLEKFLLVAINHFLSNRHYFWVKKEIKREIVLERKPEKEKVREESEEVKEKKEEERKRKYDIEAIARILDEE